MNELAHVQPGPANLPAAPIYSLADLEKMADTVAKSRLFPGIESPQAACALMLLCQAEGLHPMQALRRFHVIEGRPSMKADALQAEFQRNGGVVRWEESDAESCVARFIHPTHAPDPGVTIRVTLRELVDSGVATAWDKQKGQWAIKKMYRQYPAQMLRARCISQGVRMVLPGVAAGIYTPEEVRDSLDDERAERPAIDVTPAPAAAPEPAGRPNAERLREQQREGLLKPFMTWAADGLKDANRYFREQWAAAGRPELPEDFTLLKLEHLVAGLHDAASATNLVAERTAKQKPAQLAATLTKVFPEHRDKFREWSRGMFRVAAERLISEFEDGPAGGGDAEADPDYDAPPENAGDAWEPSDPPVEALAN